MLVCEYCHYQMSAEEVEMGRVYAEDKTYHIECPKCGKANIR